MPPSRHRRALYNQHLLAMPSCARLALLVLHAFLFFQSIAALPHQEGRREFLASLHRNYFPLYEALKQRSSPRDFCWEGAYPWSGARNSTQSTQLMCLPSYLVVGMSKSGTALLHRLLQDHPQVASEQPVEKEHHLFSKLMVSVKQAQGYLSTHASAHRQHAAEAVDHREQPSGSLRRLLYAVTGDADYTYHKDLLGQGVGLGMLPFKGKGPSALHLDWAVQELLQLLPSVRLLMVAQQPSDRVLAEWYERCAPRCAESAPVDFSMDQTCGCNQGGGLQPAAFHAVMEAAVPMMRACARIKGLDACILQGYMDVRDGMCDALCQGGGLGEGSAGGYADLPGDSWLGPGGDEGDDVEELPPSGFPGSLEAEAAPRDDPGWRRARSLLQDGEDGDFTQEVLSRGVGLEDNGPDNSSSVDMVASVGGTASSPGGQDTPTGGFRCNHFYTRKRQPPRIPSGKPAPSGRPTMVDWRNPRVLCPAHGLEGMSLLVSSFYHVFYAAWLRGGAERSNLLVLDEGELAREGPEASQRVLSAAFRHIGVDVPPPGHALWKDVFQREIASTAGDGTYGQGMLPQTRALLDGLFQEPNRRFSALLVREQPDFTFEYGMGT